MTKHAKQNDYASQDVKYNCFRTGKVSEILEEIFEVSIKKYTKYNAKFDLRNRIEGTVTHPKYHNQSCTNPGFCAFKKININKKNDIIYQYK
jgi:hypothetical protein